MSEHSAPQGECPACPAPSIAGEPVNPCPGCGEHVNPHILATSPRCPHGWESVAGSADLADAHVEAWVDDHRRSPYYVPALSTTTEGKEAMNEKEVVTDDREPTVFDRAMALVWLAETKGEFVAAKASVERIIGDQGWRP